MPAFCITFQIHQPCQLKHYSFFDIGESSVYENESRTAESLKKSVEDLTLPSLQILLKHVTDYRGEFRIAFCASGTFLDSCEKLQPRVMDVLKRLADTGCVEFLTTPYYLSLSSEVSLQEFKEQTVLHSERIKSLFGQSPKVFANTGLIYNDALAGEIETLGYLAILAGGAGLLADKQSPNYVYQPGSCTAMKLLINQVVNPTDPLQIQSRGKVINLWLNLSSPVGTPGRESDMLSFLEQLPGSILWENKGKSLTPSQAAGAFKSSTVLSSPSTRSIIPPHDMTPWLGNEMQKDALQALYLVENEVKRLHDPTVLRTWRILQDADHFLGMGTRPHAHPAINVYDSPYDAYINFMNILTDLSERVEARA